MTPNQLDALLELLAATADAEIDCEDALDRLSELAESLSAGDRAEAHAQVAQHLRVCACCRQELELLRAILEAEA